MEQLNITTTPASSLTLYDLQRLVRSTLESCFADPVWISAEISELKLNRSGHCYLNLVEKGSTDATPRAEARAVIWKSSYERLVRLFEDATHSVLSSGIRVLVRVIVTYHEVYGFSLQIIDIDPSYTLGDIERRRMETIAQLKRDGVWDMNRAVPLPHPVLRVAVVSSPTAAGYQDFLRELQRTPYRFSITLFESLMQGDMAEASVIRALGMIAQREAEFDVVAIIRGGGSVSDLALFDSYRIASHVAQFPLPVITGIGHDKDRSVVDLVAHTSCKTPTAVATLLVEMADLEMATIDEYSYKLRDMVVARINGERLNLERSSAEIARSSAVAVNGMQHRLDNIEQNIATLAHSIIRGEEQRLSAQLTIIEQSNPEHILRKGFAIVRGVDGCTINPQNIEPGADVSIELATGIIKANVTSKTLKEVL
jgi:exodeoxyribonuclease VII large subunit